MICPECNGVRRVRKRFLLFFTRRAWCPTCLGTGEYPPPARKMVGPRARYRGDTSDRWPSASDTWTGTTTIGLSGSSDSDTRHDERVEIAGGGASGGAGGGASWDDSKESDAPVIVDPFASDVSSIEAAAVADDSTPIESDSGSSTSESSESSSSSDSGTSY
jgi:hypothetical protein